MNSLPEQRIWDYLDGLASPREQKEIKQLIKSDPVYRSIYQELSALKNSLSEMEMDEPSMSFVRNVMEKIKSEPAPDTVRPLIDNRIIYGIVGFFLGTITILSAIIISKTDWSRPLKYSFSDIDLKIYSNSYVIYGFLFLDIILVLYILDAFFRKKIKNNSE